MFWITVCVPQAVLLNKMIFFGQFIFLALVEAGWLLSTIVTTFLFSRLRGFMVHPLAIPVIFKLFSLTFLYFAINMTNNSIAFFLEK
jgi:hypothetical protein